MKLVPFFLQKNETSILTVYRLSLFLCDGGRSLWEVGNESLDVLQKEYLEENGFYTSSMHTWNDIVFAKLDPVRTKKTSFYAWEEIQELPEKKREDCFRTFTFCFEKPNEKSWFFSESLSHPFDGRVETPSAIFEGLKNIYIEKV